MININAPGVAGVLSPTTTERAIKPSDGHLGLANPNDPLRYVHRSLQPRQAAALALTSWHSMNNELPRPYGISGQTSKTALGKLLHQIH